jgi:hypothetical protein
MDELNPYAPPKADLDLELIEFGVWRDGPLVVMTKGSALPPRCLKCNAPTGGRTLKRKLMWHAPYWYLLILFNLIIYAIVAMIVRHTAIVMVPLCEAHRRRRRRMIALAWAIVLAAIASFIAAVVVSDTYPNAAGIGILVALALLLAGLLVGAFGTRTAVPKRIDKQYVWLQKVHPNFLAELPPWAV